MSFCLLLAAVAYVASINGINRSGKYKQAALAPTNLDIMTVELLVWLCCVVLLLSTCTFWLGWSLCARRFAGRTESESMLYGDLSQARAEITRLAASCAVSNERGRRLDELQANIVDCSEMLRETEVQRNYLQTQLQVAESLREQENVAARDRNTYLERSNSELKQQFEVVSAKIFADNNRAMADLAQSQIGGLITPLREQLGEFKKRVEDTYDRDLRDRSVLRAEIGQLKTLNERISQDAVNLTNALRGNNKTFGNWGELILERVLESAGLQKGRDYERELSFSSADGSRVRPDVIVRLPRGRDVVIDAKASVVAFEKALAEDDKTLQKQWMQQHVKSLRNHVEGLSIKAYESIAEINSLDFVLLFVPVEAAFQAALEHDQSLYRDAYERDVILVGPASLMVTCRTIQNIWRSEQQSKNAALIARKAGELIDKFSAFTSELDKVGAALENASDSYQTARRRLTTGRGNLVVRARALEQLGATGKKALKS